jgi:hypothetical protein
LLHAQTLSRLDKIRLIQFLAGELARDERCPRDLEETDPLWEPVQAVSPLIAESTGKPARAGRRRIKRRVNKTELVREALRALGRDVKNQEIQQWIKEMHGVELSPAHISNIKSVVLVEMRESEKGQRPFDKGNWYDPAR